MPNRAPVATNASLTTSDRAGHPALPATRRTTPGTGPRPLAARATADRPGARRSPTWPASGATPVHPAGPPARAARAAGRSPPRVAPVPRRPDRFDTRAPALFLL